MNFDSDKDGLDIVSMHRDEKPARRSLLNTVEVRPRLVFSTIADPETLDAIVVLRDKDIS